MSTNRNEFNSLKYLEPLCRLAYFLGVYNFSKNRPDKKCPYKFYAYFIMCVIIFGSLGSLVGRVADLYKYLPTTLVIIDGLLQLTITLVNLSSVFYMSVKYGDGLRKFTSQFLKVDEEILFRKNSVWSFRKEFLLSQIFVLVYYGYDAYFWNTTITIKSYKNYLFRSVQNYHAFVVTLLIRHYILAVRNRFKYLNKIIGRRFNPFCVDVNNVKGNYRRLARVYTLLSEQVEVCNKIFGYPLLFLSLYFACGFLHIFILCVLYYLTNKEDLGGVTFGTDMLVFCIVSSVKHVVLFLFVISPCDDATGEAKQTSIICYKLLQELPNVNSIFQDKSMRDDLVLLAIQSSTKYPTFSAAGFFTVDYTMLFTLLGSITSYLVVLIQFN